MQIGTIHTSTISTCVSLTTGSRRTSAGSSGGSDPGAAVSLDASEHMKLLDQLSTLQQSDPDKAAQVASNVADQLEQAASDSGDENLARLAANFREVANGTAVEDAFQPPQGAGGPRGAGGPPPGPPPGVSAGDNDDTTTELLQQLAEDAAASTETDTSGGASSADSASSGAATRAVNQYLSNSTAMTVDEMLRSALAAA